MDGIHDLGGMNGFGAVEVEIDEPTFHEPWEALAFGLNVFSLAVLRAYNVDEYRHAIERMLPVHYLSASYYERTLTAVASLLVEKGLISHEELEKQAGGAFPLSTPNASVTAAPSVLRTPSPHSSSPRFQCGDRVRVRKMHPIGHTRVPRYVRGASGEILHATPRFRLPDASAHGLPEHKEPTYHVLFRAEDLWPEAAGSRETVVVDLWETYLELVE